VQNTSGNWYQMKMAPYNTLQHQISGVVITFVDITAFKQANLKLIQLSAAMEQSPLSVVITNLDGNIEYVNSRFTQLTGYNLDEIIGKNPSILQSGQTPTEAYHELWESLTQGREWRGEFINRKKNGDVFHEFANISPVLDDDGKPIHYLAVKEDITEQKKVEEALRKSEYRYRFLISAIPHTSILVFDHDLRYLVAGGEELLNNSFDTKKMEGSTLDEVFSDELVTLFKPLYEQALRGETISFDHTYNNLSYHQTILPIHDETGEIEAGMVVTKNITK